MWGHADDYRVAESLAALLMPSWEGIRGSDVYDAELANRLKCP